MGADGVSPSMQTEGEGAWRGCEVGLSLILTLALTLGLAPTLTLTQAVGSLTRWLRVARAQRRRRRWRRRAR